MGWYRVEIARICHLRFDDTNPTKESQEYVDAIMRDIRWLGFDWGEHLYHASDYFEQLYQWAEQLIRAGQAYVDDLSAEEMSEYLTNWQPGSTSTVKYTDPGFIRALETHRWRKHDVARQLGMSRTTLWRKMRQMGLE